MIMLTIKQAAQATGYHRQTINKRLSKGDVRGVKSKGVTGAWLIPKKEVEKLRLQRIDELTRKIEEISKPVI